MYEKSIDLLNQAVADELMAVHQYMYFHFHLDDQGYDLLAALFKRTAVEEMMHIERIAERILFLKGDVKLEASGPVQAITDPAAMLNMARDMEQQSVLDYNRMAVDCGNNADSATKKIFEDLVADEERHFGNYDTEADNLQKFGQGYLALQSIERAKTGGQPGAE